MTDKVDKKTTVKAEDKKANKPDKKQNKIAKPKLIKEKPKKADKEDKKGAKVDKKSKEAENKDKQNIKAADNKNNDKQNVKAAENKDKQISDNKNKENKKQTSKTEQSKPKLNLIKKKTDPKPKEEEKPKVLFVDKPDKPERPSSYIHKVVQLDRKNNQFTDKQFQQVRKATSATFEIIESFHRIGMDLSKSDLSQLPKEKLEKICLVLVNNYQKEGLSQTLGVAPLNDAYLFSLIHHKLGYKIVFLFNPEKATFVSSLEFFVMNTHSALTIYYSGRDSSSHTKRISHGIKFLNGEVLSSIQFGKIVGEKSNGEAKILIFSDCGSGLSIFNMKAATSTDNGHCSEIVSFSVNKKSLEPKERRDSQGLFTYYFCKLIHQFPNSSPKEMAEMLNIALQRFGEVFTTQVSSVEANESPMFPGANALFNPQNKKPTDQNDAANGASVPAETQ